jgi:hypothetical protein
VNVLTLFYTYGRGSELYRTLQWVHDVLLHRAYLDGTRYYSTPESYLFFLGRLLRSSDSTELHELLGPLLKERIKELIGTEGDALALAMRIITCTYVGLENEVDLRKLLSLQCEDGGWEIGWIYKYGSSNIKIGNRGLTTAMAIKAIEAMEPPRNLAPPAEPLPLSLHAPLSPLAPLLSAKRPRPQWEPEGEPPSTRRRSVNMGRRNTEGDLLLQPKVESTTTANATATAVPDVRRERHSRCGSMQLSFQWLRKSLDV